MDVCCASGAPVIVYYTPKGTFEQIGDAQVYITGAGEKCLIAIYDIFGFKYPQFQQVCDRLAAATGFMVAAPDIFRGQPWSMDKSPPKPEDNLQGWIKGYSWELVRKDIYAVVEALRAKGVTKFGSVGFCWGACMAIQALADPAAFSAAALLHPTLFGRDKELCSAARGPLITISTPGDPYESVKEAMDGTEWGPKCVYRRYDNMIHGFCAARGKFDDPEVAAAVGEVLALLAEFFTRNM